MKKLVDWADVVIFQGYIMFENPVIAASNKVVVADIYDPFHLEQLEQARDLIPAIAATWCARPPMCSTSSSLVAISSSARVRSSATSGSASSRRSAGSTRSRTTPTRRSKGSCGSCRSG